MKNNQLLIFLVSVFFVAVSATHYESIFNFGDSLSDTGNIIVEIPNIPSGSGNMNPGNPPYGQTFFKQPTGRSSDGRLIIDFIAEANCLPYLPPYLSLEKDKNLNITKIRQGVNFAVAGCTALDKKFLEKKGVRVVPTNSSLNVQIEWFKKIKPSLCCTQQECDKYFKKALFFVGEIGGNDLNYILLSAGKKAQQKVGRLIPLVIQTITNAVDTLINEGAKTLVVPGNFPFGCDPIYFSGFTKLDNSKLDGNGCLKGLNGISQGFNAGLIKAIELLRCKHPSAKIIYADYYGAALQIFKDPLKFGFEKNFRRACCGGGGEYNQHKDVKCGDKTGITLCPDPSKSVSWDGIHFTEAAYCNIASSLLDTFTNPPGFLNTSSYV